MKTKRKTALKNKINKKRLKQLAGMTSTEFKREAVWEKLHNKPIETFDVSGDWAMLTGLSGKELATRIHIPTAVKQFKNKIQKSKSSEQLVQEIINKNLEKDVWNF